MHRIKTVLYAFFKTLNSLVFTTFPVSSTKNEFIIIYLLKTSVGESYF